MKAKMTDQKYLIKKFRLENIRSENSD